MKPLNTGWKVCAMIFCGLGAIQFGRWQQSWHAGMWMLVVLFLPVAIAQGLTEKRKES